MISGAFKPFSEAELAAIGEFLQSGGRLAIMLHIAQPLIPLLGKLGVASANGVVREGEKSLILDQEPLNFKVMNLTEHPGPKAQVHLVGTENPIYFSQVRDAIAYQRMPEQSSRISVIYVNDMAVAPNWHEPGLENWIPASTALYVAGSDAIGGMGAEEFVPFSTRAAAEAFSAEHGGRVVSLSGIDDAEVLSPVDKGPETGEDEHYHERLKTLSDEGRG